jgi:fused signal recognition particle receptor
MTADPPADEAQAGDVAAWAELFGLDAPPAPAEEEAPRRRGLFARLKANLTKPRQAISPQLAGIFAPRLVTAATWEDLEEALITADCGMQATDALVEHLREEAGQGRIISGESLAQALWQEVAARMAPEPARIRLGHAPTVILVVGVNGSGKTTTIGKLAFRLGQLGQRVVIGAADTFRAAAIDQLEVWADRAGAQLVRQAHGADPGAVAYDAVVAGRARGADVVIIDTAGRLQTQHNLMEELRKVGAVIGKVDAEAPHETLLVLDSTTGQNGLSQARLFSEAVPLTGVALTKLDGSAKGGIALAIRQDLGLPVKLVGTGETLEDLQPFDARSFARAIFAPEGSPA